MSASDILLSSVIGGILIYGMIKNVDIYGVFVEGALEGAKSAVKIFPYILAVVFAINLFIHSGAEAFIVGILSPLTSMIGFPPEILSLSIVKPLSGGGSLGVFKTILDIYGPDSYIGRTASVLMGSSETIFYTVAVYFGAVGIKNVRYTIKVGLIAHCASIFAALAVCKLMF
ncbi:MULTISPECIES: spore maturation protein [unclassified Sedimentibacter]|uniref:spore maturation protein n=1 Tax=unclassified Sedimentibacter TaxID=2649220 RepID=UPI0027E1F4B9|nr:nucleoside recognition domain-containing protein [Sedimentibacter sp. MB35-C1]WMJ75764.1 spore maturation protein [Sedimentibacter sp. MB35-C1]